MGLFVKDGEGILAQPGNETSINVGYGDIETDQVGVGNDRVFVIYAAFG